MAIAVRTQSAHASQIGRVMTARIECALTLSRGSILQQHLKTRTITQSAQTKVFAIARKVHASASLDTRGKRVNAHSALVGAQVMASANILKKSQRTRELEVIHHMPMWANGIALRRKVACAIRTGPVRIAPHVCVPKVMIL